ncbi:T9SS type A sorting domain-containing protein [Bernardetia sp. OM2101]|uniref:T9SS type A sorting domain-containing protein n=1 Tax=Bernardetia sp. OM2101 TaxID=3344876 RepID=UPI0035D110ED
MKNYFFKTLLFLFLSFTAIALQAQTTTYYVDIDAPLGGDGLTWATAFNNLQDGIDNAATVFANNGTGIVRVSDGTYPAPVTGFQLKNGVQIWGGYNSRSAPDWLINATRFYGGVSTTVLGTSCFIANQNLGNQTILDGMNILPPSTGTFYGIEIKNTCQVFEMSVNNCSFGRDMNHFFSGLYGIASTQNSYVTGTFNPKINNCTFYTIVGINLEIGGTIAADISINNSTFHNNHNASIHLYSHYSTTINNIGNVDLNINNSRFNIDRNGIWLELHGNNMTSNANVTNSILTSSFSYTNSTGIDLRFHTDLTATNCTLYGLSQPIMKTNTVLSTFNNCIFWDSNYIIVDAGTSGFVPATFNNCLVDVSSCSAINPSSNHITCNNVIYNQNPQFLSTDSNSSDYLKLSNSSPARNAGNNSFIPVGVTKGYGGNSRILENIVDMGAYELCPSRACSSSSHLPSRKITAAVSNSEINSIVYPNPATNVLNIKSDSEIVSISLLNVQGQEVKKWNTKNKLYIGDLPIGMYLLKVNTTERIEHIRIIKE